MLGYSMHSLVCCFYLHTLIVKPWFFLHLIMLLLMMYRFYGVPQLLVNDVINSCSIHKRRTHRVRGNKFIVSLEFSPYCSLHCRPCTRTRPHPCAPGISQTCSSWREGGGQSLVWTHAGGQSTQSLVWTHAGGQSIQSLEWSRGSKYTVISVDTCRGSKYTVISVDTCRGSKYTVIRGHLIMAKLCVYMQYHSERSAVYILP